MKRSILAFLILTAIAHTAHGHATSKGALHVLVREGEVQANVSLEVSDLDALLDLDADGDRRVTPQEVQAQAAAIADYVLGRVELKTDGRFCARDGAQVVLAETIVQTNFVGHCALPFAELRLRYEVFFEHDEGHRGFIRVEAGDQSWSAVATSQRRELTVQRGSTETWRDLLDHVQEGILHIWLGFDHVLFLLTLLLPAVLARQPAEGALPTLRATLIEVVRVVTAFTVAHSVTLGLAALEFVRPNERLVESAIAASIIVAALCNLPSEPRVRGPALAFVFGLVHGFGFANVLSELSLPSRSVLTALLGFNLGVEVGQLCLVAGFLPLAFVLRTRSWFGRHALRGGSLLVAAVAAVWLCERAFQLEIFTALPVLRSNLAHPLALGGLALVAIAACAALVTPTRGLGWSLARPRSLLVVGVAMVVSGIVLSAFQSRRALAGALERAEAERRDAFRHLREHQLGQASSRLLAASTLFERAADPASQADVLSRLGALELTRADPAAARTHYLRVLAIREQRSDRRGMVSTLHELAVVAQVRGDKTEEASWLRRALDLEQELGLPLMARRDAAQLAHLYRQSEQFEAAVEAQVTAIQIDEAQGFGRELAQDLSKLAVIHQLRGALEEARSTFARAIALHEALGDHGELAKALANDANVARSLGRAGEARERYARSLASFERASDREGAERVRRLLAQVEP